ncbi:Iguana/Dzip1-like DAZ-interacting protein N-terminal, putative [Angomonas deanei]|uniref:Iguana/Dzip1-like DAZ-interacting protein N-terminal, putative n=1 Tax=Angomonas deanei TaxID=59799 RepID=A0A7G2CSW8_9TRYP|nr:Iguana/Dzip1-like DAZ-interacting protein N-terminal, putative [Angomonas deanei]
MSIEKIKRFRYTSGGGELSWPTLRRIDVASFRAEEPDLRFLANLIASLANSSISLLTVREGTDTDLVQLLQLFQMGLQFALWSQNVLKEELVETQNKGAVSTVTSRYVAELEMKNKRVKSKLEGVMRENETLQMSSSGLTKSLSQMETAVDLLQKQLKAERSRSAELVDRLEKQGDRFHSKALQAQMTPHMPVPENPYVDDNGVRWVVDHKGRPRCPVCQAKRKKRVAASDTTSFTESSTTESRSHRHHPKSRWFARSRLEEDYLLTHLLDLQTQRSTPPPQMVVQQQPAPAPVSDVSMIVQKQLELVSDNVKKLTDNVERQITSLNQRTDSDLTRQSRQLEEMVSSLQNGQRQLKEECLETIQQMKTEIENKVSEQIKTTEEQKKASPPRAVPLSARSDRPITGRPKSLPRPASAKSLPNKPFQRESSNARPASVQMSSSYISMDREPLEDTLARPPAAPLVSSGYSPYNEDQPIGVFVRQPSAMDSYMGDSADASRHSSPVRGGKQFPSGQEDPSTPDRHDADEPVACIFCHQRFSKGDLYSHETNCEFRVVPCDKCGAKVVARMLPKHKCNSKYASSEHGSQSASMLQDAQRELKALMDEDAAESNQKQ